MKNVIVIAEFVWDWTQIQRRRLARPQMSEGNDIDCGSELVPNGGSGNEQI